MIKKILIGLLIIISYLNLNAQDKEESVLASARIDLKQKKNTTSLAKNNKAVLPTQAQIRYQQTIKGGVTMIGNSWFYSNPTANDTMLTADVDGDNSTAMSSSADLILPAGSKIEKVFLSIESGYYTYNKFTDLKLKVPGAANYSTLTAATSLANNLYFDGAYEGYAQMIWDITALVPTNAYVSTGGGGAAGRFYLADPNPLPYNMGGWSIIVVYSNPNSKFRSITVADGWQYFYNSAVEINVPNIKVPSTGIVTAVIGVTGTYGDRGYEDFIKFGKKDNTLALLKDPMTGSQVDALNSSIAWTSVNNVSADGGPSISGNYTARNPISAGHIYGTAESWDYDSDIFDASGILPPSSSPTDITFRQESTGGDILISGSYFISVDLGVPVLTKNVTPASIMDGGIATYTFHINNTTSGAINQSAISFTDVLPSGLKIASTPNAIITGGSGGIVTAVAGGNSVSLSGFSLNANQTATITVDVTNVTGQLNSSCAANPVAFTNNAANITAISSNLANGVGNICLLVTTPCSITASNPDSDGDGVSNFCDLDDDNDGILDTDECGSNNRISNETFPTSGGNTNTVAGWTVGGTYAASGAWASPTGRVNLNANGLEFKRDFNTVTTLSQNLTGVMPGSLLSLNDLYWYRTAGVETDNAFTLDISYGGVVYATITSTGVPAPKIFASNGAMVNISSLPSIASQVNISAKTNLLITLPSGSIAPSGQLLFTFTAGPASTQVRDLGMRSVTLFSCKDTDDDGIPDYLDLDSDNDGCLDAIEGGAAITSSQLVNAGGSVTVGIGSTGSNKNLCAGPGCIDSNGIPVIVGVSGQGVGSSQNKSLTACLPVCGFDNTNGGNTTPVPVAKSNISVNTAPTITYLQNASASASRTNEFDFGGVNLTNSTGATIPNVLLDVSKLGFWTQNVSGTTFKLYTYNQANQSWEGTLGNGQTAYFKILGVSVNGAQITNPNIRLLPVQNSASVTGYHFASTGNTVSDAATSFTDGGTGSNYSITGATVSLPANLPVIDLGALTNGSTLTNVKIRMGLVMPNNADAWVNNPDTGTGDIDYYIYAFADVWGTGYDFGDAPSSYGIAQHAPALCSPAIYIGPNRQDYESSVTGSATADGDDINLTNYDDENDNLPDYSTNQTSYSVTLPYVNNAASGTISAWIDWNNNSIFDTSERATAIITAGIANVTLTWRISGATIGEGTIPASVPSGYKMVRTRIGTISSEILNPFGIAADGEVEDRLLFVTGYCTKPGDFSQSGTPTKVGITSQTKLSGWPESVPNGHIALESIDKGFVITRVPHVSTTPDFANDSVKDPKEGMIVYDIQDKCVKLYNGSVWKCIQRSCNDYPDGSTSKNLR